jgi:DNA-binding MarR family transcriptional regulator
MNDTERGIADRLHSAAIHLLRHVRTEDAESGLTASRLSALSVIVFGGPISISDLAAAEQVRPPTISRLAKEMGWEGLVRRERDSTDRRIVRLRATAKGRQLLLEGRERRIAKLAQRVAECGSCRVDARSSCYLFS